VNEGIHVPLIGKMNEAIGRLRLEIAKGVLPQLAAVDLQLAIQADMQRRQADPAAAPNLQLNVQIIGQAAMAYADNLLVAAGVIKPVDGVQQ
jgi:hypothetical protein